MTPALDNVKDYRRQVSVILHDDRTVRAQRRDGAGCAVRARRCGVRGAGAAVRAVHVASPVHPRVGAVDQWAHPEPLRARLAGVRRTLVMGVVNVTPDSFSDGGLWLEPGDAVQHGLRLLDEGADLLDVGGESTRPGARRVPVDEERRRVLPVIEALVDAGALVSVDTTRSQVARDACSIGALVVNDVSGGLADPAMYDAVAGLEAAYVAMHWRGHADVMDSLARYDDVVTDVRDELAQRLTALEAAGVARDRVVVDPGLGFAKPGSDNWPLLSHLGVLRSLGRPVLVGASRKRFLGHLLAGPDGEPAPPQERDRATAAVTALAAAAGAWCVRVHDVAGSADAVRVVAAWTEASGPRHDIAPHPDTAPHRDIAPHRDTAPDTTDGGSRA